MRLFKARVRCYRSIIDSGEFEVEKNKTILVGPNEAGKTVLLQALQQLNPTEDVKGFDALRDYPRSKYTEISRGEVDPAKTTVVEGHFKLDPADIEGFPNDYGECVYVVGRTLDGKAWHILQGGPTSRPLSEVKKDLDILKASLDKRAVAAGSASDQPDEGLSEITEDWDLETNMDTDEAEAVSSWLKDVRELVGKEAVDEDVLLLRIQHDCDLATQREAVREALWKRIPVFVLFNNYFRVRPNIHLDHLARRMETNVLDEEWFDYGNMCLLKLLGFTARQLADLGKTTEPARDNTVAYEAFRAQLDKRQYELNAASVFLSGEIRTVWMPDGKGTDNLRLRLIADGQYLKLVVEDEMGVEIELDQRSEGFQWLVSFFVVFFAEAKGKHENAILLLDEPGLSLHGLKQRDFRKTVSRLAETNQTIYTTHSPFLVGPDELDLVRVVELVDRAVGTKVHTTVTASDSAALLPLQEALGYDLAQTLFVHKRNLVLEGLTDLWYIEATAQMLREAGAADLNDEIALIPANNAGKVVYYATILHAQGLAVAALLDSDAAGDQAARQEVLVHTLGNKHILRTKDAYKGDVDTPEVEDLLRDTLLSVAAQEFGHDAQAAAKAQPKRPVCDILHAEVPGFSKYRLAKAYIRWTRDHKADSLGAAERANWTKLIQNVNKALR